MDAQDSLARDDWAGESRQGVLVDHLYRDDRTDAECDAENGQREERALGPEAGTEHADQVSNHGIARVPLCISHVSSARAATSGE